uniref:Putative capsid protein n=1 Tax=viral metagenome TaxID=1070528 RepID=A0A6M3M3A8_9ZZZZ
MQMTKEQLEELIGSQVKGQLETMGTKITEGLNKQIMEGVKSVLSEKPDIRKMLIPDTDDDTQRTEDPKAGFKCLSEFAIAVKNASVSGMRNVDKRLDSLSTKAAGTGVNEGDSEYGGYLIPEEFRNQLLEIAIKKSNILSMALTIPMMTNAIHIPYVSGTDRSGGLVHGGIEFSWLDEEGAKSETRPKFGKIQLRLKKMAGLVYASDEILEDSPISLEPLLSRMFSDALAWQLDNVFINGSGAGKPLGVLNAPCLISVAKEAGQLADTIIFENVIKMYARMWDKTNAVFMANDDTFQQLAQMSLSVGTAGAPVWLPAGGASGKPYDTLFGKPLIFTEHCQKIGDAGDILFADWSQYLVGQKSGGTVQFASSMHLKFDLIGKVPCKVTCIEKSRELMGTPTYEYAKAA